MQDLKTAFIEAFKTAFVQEKLVKITLSKANDKKNSLKNIYGRRVLIKQKAHISWTFRHETKDETKNVELATACAQLSEWLENDFAIATLACTDQDTRWEQTAKKLFFQKASQTQAPNPQHNQNKNYLIAENSPFLITLGISSQQGKVHAAQQHKFRQINKYIEIVDNLLKNNEKELKILDMGSGKGYLTFALYQYFKIQKNRNISIKGVELRQHLADFCNGVAQQLGWQNDINFIADDIKNIDNQDFNVLIALHACDTATDLALAKGIAAQAEFIIVAPCCQKQVRKEMENKGILQNILKNGILQERQAEILTDGIRALLLENEGYQTKIFEFIDYEHTSKNLMISAQKVGEKNNRHSAEIAEIKAQFGFKTHFLETLLQ